MREENYLYFATAGGNSADKDMAMFPASTFRGAVTMSSTEVEFFFAPQDGTGTTANGLILRHADIASNASTGTSPYADDLHYTVMEKFAQLASGNRKNTTNFTVIKDLNTLPANEGAISSSGIDEVSAVVLTID
tara:strand:+ start:1874 stop:2275 length:402 start_codon:yes stop_codon:yes gene_type:complete